MKQKLISLKKKRKRYGSVRSSKRFFYGLTFKLELTFISAVTGCVSIFAFASLFGIAICIASFTVGIEICAITAEIKNYKSITKKKNKHDEIVLLAET